MKKITRFALIVLLIPYLSHCKKSGSDKPKKVIVTTIAGIGESGYLDATAAFAKFNFPVDIAMQSDGTLFITDSYNYRVRKLSTNGLVYTVAGTGNSGNTNGPVTAATFGLTTYIAVNTSGDVYVVDINSYQIRQINGGTTVSVYAGSTYGYANGAVGSAQFHLLAGITLTGNGTMYVVEKDKPRIRKISNGNVTTVAGTGTPGYLDGPALQAQFKRPTGIAIDKQENLFICDGDNYRIRKITPDGTVSTLAGTGIEGFVDGDAATARFSELGDMIVDKSGNLYVTDKYAIRKITPSGEVTTIAGSSSGFADGEGRTALFRLPTGLGIDGAGNIYVADAGSHSIRKISFE